MIVKGTWVEIENTVLEAEERAEKISPDTKKTALMMWVRGFLVDDKADINDIVRIKTLTGRLVKGRLVDLNPRFDHDFGDTVSELLDAGVSIMEVLSSIEED